MLYTGSVFKVYLLIVVSKLSNKRLVISKIVVLNFNIAFLHLL